MAGKINTWGDRDAGRINRTVLHVESRPVRRAPQRPLRNDSEVYRVKALRIRGTVTGGQINTGAVGNIAGLVGVDGIVHEPDPMPVRNQITGFAIPNGSTVLAQYVHESGEWEVIEIAGEGSPTTPEPVAYGDLIVASDVITGDNSYKKVLLNAAQIASLNVDSDTTNNKIVIDTFSGVYLISASCSINLNAISGLSTDHHESVNLGVFVNGGGPAWERFLTVYFDQNDGLPVVHNVAFSFLYVLALNDEIDLRAKADARDINIFDAILTVLRVAGAP